MIITVTRNGTNSITKGDGSRSHSRRCNRRRTACACPIDACCHRLRQHPPHRAAGRVGCKQQRTRTRTNKRNPTQFLNCAVAVIHLVQYFRDLVPIVQGVLRVCRSYHKVQVPCCWLHCQRAHRRQRHTGCCCSIHQRRGIVCAVAHDCGYDSGHRVINQRCGFHHANAGVAGVSDVRERVASSEVVPERDVRGGVKGCKGGEPAIAAI